MIQYKYHRAASLDDVVKVLKEYGGKARIVAGGTDIMVQIHEKDKRWKDLQCLLDITYLDKELRYISEDEEYVYIGPLSTHTDLEQSEIIAKHIPFLGWASATVGSPQIRNRGTLGGSIGNAFPASDPLPALIAADALIKVYGQDGERVCLLKDFYEGKGSLKLEPGEFIREFVVKKLPEGTGMGFSKLGRRKALAISSLTAPQPLPWTLREPSQRPESHRDVSLYSLTEWRRQSRFSLGRNPLRNCLPKRERPFQRS